MYDDELNPSKKPSNNRTKVLGATALVVVLGAIFYWGLSTPQPKKPAYESPKIIEEAPVDTKPTAPTPEPDPKEPHIDAPQETSLMPDTQEQNLSTVDTDIQESAITPPAPLALTFPTSYTVRHGETLSTVGLKLYEDTFSWPLIYQGNMARLNDPDHVHQGLTLNIPERDQGAVLYNAYVTTFDNYLKADKFSKAFWTLCSGARTLDKNFKAYLKTHLDEADYALVERCHKRF